MPISNPPPPGADPLTDTELRAADVGVDASGHAIGVTDNGGSLTVDDGGGSLTVDGTFWQATQPVSGPLTDTQLRAAAVPVSGTVTASGPLTDTQLRATAVPVSGPLTDTQLRATAVPVSGPLTDTQLRATGVPVIDSGNVAHDAVDTGNPVKIGGKVIAAAAAPSFVSATGDRADMAVDGAGRIHVMEPVCWTITHVPAANTTAIATKAAAAGVKHVLESFNAICHNTGAVTAAVLTIVVRDGASTSGTILWTVKLPIVATTLTSNQVFYNDLHIVGTAGNALTVEFTAAGGANTNEIINATGYDTI